ncbi:MAG TPA: lysylphosphatidylglycerol synthase transmembrane domain-containing protein [bacterium]|nr:lysylphosphatidylglycerol synthase transmembrane domain-containing protein [bacterium]
MTRPIRLIFLLAGGALLAVLLVRIDVPAVRASIRAADPRWLGVSLIFLAVNILVKAGRWRWMVRRLTGHVLDLPSAAQAILAGVAAASFSPARTVDLAKPVLLKQRFDVALSTSTAAVLVERFLDGASLIVLLGASLPVLRTARGAQFHPALAAAGVLLVAGAAVLASPRTLRALAARLIGRLPISEDLRTGSSRVADAFTDGLALWRTRANLWPLLGWSVGAALCEAARLAAVFAGLGLPLGLAGGMLTFSVANLVAVVALIPGGIGITELSMAAVAGIVLGIPAASAGVAGAVLLDRVLSYYLVVGGGAVVLLGAGRSAGRVQTPSGG